jgi:hypothetical protein
METITHELLMLAHMAKLEDQLNPTTLDLGKYERQVELVLRTLRSEGYVIMAPRRGMAA